MNSLGQVGSRDSPLCGVPCPDHGLLCTRGGVGAADLLWWYAWMRCWQGSCLHKSFVAHRAILSNLLQPFFDVGLGATVSMGTE